MNKPLVSCLVPTFNRAEYVGEALTSLFNQTYKNYEIIVVDDGSTDSTDILMKYFLDKYPKKFFYYKKPHSGIAATRNFAIQKAKGEYLAVFDSDDLYVETRLARQVKVFEKNPDIDFVYSGYMEADEHLQGKSIVEPPKDFTAEDIRDNKTIPHGTLIAKRHCFIEHPYNEEFIANDDKQLFWDWYRAGYKGLPVDDALYLKRNHTEAVSYTQGEIIHKFNLRINAEIDLYLKERNEKNSRLGSTRR